MTSYGQVLLVQLFRSEISPGVCIIDGTPIRISQHTGAQTYFHYFFYIPFLFNTPLSPHPTLLKDLKESGREDAEKFITGKSFITKHTLSCLSCHFKSNQHKNTIDFWTLDHPQQQSQAPAHQMIKQVQEAARACSLKSIQS